MAEHSLTLAEATWVTSSLGFANYFEKVVAELRVRGWFKTGVPRAAFNWMSGVVASHLNDSGIEIEGSRVSPEQLAELIHLNFEQRVSNRSAKEVFAAMWSGGGTPSEVVERNGLAQISDEKAIERAVDQAVAANPKLVEDYRAGKEKAFNALVGQVMKATGGKANPTRLNEILKRRLAAKP